MSKKHEEQENASDKSYVTMEQHCCPACGKVFDTGSILLDTRLRKRFEHNTVTRWALCRDDQAKHDEGYTLLVEVDYAKSDKQPNGNIKPEGAYRLGRIVYIRNEVAARMFNVMIPDGMAYVESGVIDLLVQQEQQEQQAGDQAECLDGPSE